MQVFIVTTFRSLTADVNNRRSTKTHKNGRVVNHIETDCMTLWKMFTAHRSSSAAHTRVFDEDISSPSRTPRQSGSKSGRRKSTCHRNEHWTSYFISCHSLGIRFLFSNGPSRSRPIKMSVFSNTNLLCMFIMSETTSRFCFSECDTNAAR